MIKLCIICNIYLAVIRNFLLSRFNGFKWEFYFPIDIPKHFAATNTGVTIQLNLKLPEFLFIVSIDKACSYSCFISIFKLDCLFLHKADFVVHTLFLTIYFYFI